MIPAMLVLDIIPLDTIPFSPVLPLCLCTFPLLKFPFPITSPYARFPRFPLLFPYQKHIPLLYTYVRLDQ